MKEKRNVGLTDEQKQFIQKKVRQFTGQTSGAKVTAYKNEDGSIDIEKLTRAVATTNSLARRRTQVEEYIKTIFERDRRADEIIAEELQNFNIQEVQK